MAGSKPPSGYLFSSSLPPRLTWYLRNSLISCGLTILTHRSKVSMGNSYGKIFRITTFGESHGPAIGVIVDGCPAGLAIDEAFIQSELARRKPGQSRITTQRKEDDTL